MIPVIHLAMRLTVHDSASSGQFPGLAVSTSPLDRAYFAHWANGDRVYLAHGLLANGEVDITNPGIDHLTMPPKIGVLFDASIRSYNVDRTLTTSRMLKTHILTHLLHVYGNACSDKHLVMTHKVVIIFR